MKPLTKLFCVLLGISTAAAVVMRTTGLADALLVDPVVVVHWSNGHLMRHGTLLPRMAEEFNAARHRTDSGRPIEVRVHYYGSWEQAEDLLSRVNRGVALDPERPDPTIVTPSAAHWLVPVNHGAGREVVDLAGARSIARAMIGIVTYRDMAECLGWPQREIGYADIIALRADPLGWSRHPCAKTEWGRQPLVAYTDPTTSSTGRSVLFALYAIAAGKSPEALEIDDVTDPEVVRYVRAFQGLVDHYMISTRHVSTKIYQGPRYGHFFIMPEDNLAHLREGTEKIYIDGRKVQAPPLTAPMVFIHPKEGAMARNNCACIVRAPWVDAEQVEAADRWVEFLHEDRQQRDFNSAGFRPVTGIDHRDPLTGGPTGPVPERLLHPEQVAPEVAARIEASWQEVKRPGIVTFVVDTSGSMSGDKLQQAKDGLVRALDGMSSNNRAGLVAFDTEVHTRVPIAPLATNRYEIATAVRALRANGSTALYDALRAAIDMTDSAEGPGGAIRGVVLLTDGRAGRESSTALDDLVQMISTDEVPIERFEGYVGSSAVDQRGAIIEPERVIGTRLAAGTDHPIQIFFVGIGDDADMEVGRILAQATGAEFQGAAEADLAAILEQYGKYF